MYIIDGIAHASEMTPGIAVQEARSVGNLCMLVGFSTGETRLFDASPLLDFPAFAPLASEGVFDDVRVVRGILTWLDESIDISTERVYRMSYEYGAVA